MRATIWGCRGTLASPGPETVRYGGQTSCIVVDTDDETTRSELSDSNKANGDISGSYSVAALSG